MLSFSPLPPSHDQTLNSHGSDSGGGKGLYQSVYAVKRVKMRIGFGY
jgi:hypothetical protein